MRSTIKSKSQGLMSVSDIAMRINRSEITARRIIKSIAIDHPDIIFRTNERGKIFIRVGELAKVCPELLVGNDTAQQIYLLTQDIDRISAELKSLRALMLMQT